MRNDYWQGREKRRGGATGTWFAAGAAAAYFFDPNRGNRRRALLRDKLISSINGTRKHLYKAAEDTRNRAVGLAAETQARLTADDADYRTIAARVRSAIGRAVSHPSAIEVTAEDGVVTLRGPVLAHEVDALRSTTSGVRGVRGVVEQLEVHEQPGDVPELQGGSARSGQRSGIMEENWNPSTRLFASLGGVGLAVWGLGKGNLLGFLATGLGATVASRGIMNLPVKRLTGIGAGRRAVEVRKTLVIHAPLDLVFGFFANYQNFPRFMSNVREVRDSGMGRSHWVVAGPMGVEVSWDADLTAYGPNEVIAWRSVAGARVANAGIIEFREEDGGTRVDIKLSYNPPAGAIGHFLAKLFGSDPKSEMDADLARLKTTLETGQPPRDAAQPLKAAATSQA